MARLHNIYMFWSITRKMNRSTSKTERYKMKGLPTLTLEYCFGRKELARLYMYPVLENIDIEEKNVQTLGANTFL